ncbi:MAG: lipoyl domain-containing protein [Sphingomonadaceae bacterium]
MTDIIIPAGLWEDSDTAVIGSWLYNEGDVVQAGAVIAEIMVEKSSYELTAPAGGTLHIGAAEESEVRAGQIVGRIG